MKDKDMLKPRLFSKLSSVLVKYTWKHKVIGFYFNGEPFIDVCMPGTGYIAGAKEQTYLATGSHGKLYVDTSEYQIGLGGEKYFFIRQVKTDDSKSLAWVAATVKLPNESEIDGEKYKTIIVDPKSNYELYKRDFVYFSSRYDASKYTKGMSGSEKLALGTIIVVIAIFAATRYNPIEPFLHLLHIT